MLLLLFFKKNVFITIGFILFAKVLFKKYLYRIIYILEGKKRNVDLAMVKSFISFGLCSAECFQKKERKLLISHIQPIHFTTIISHIRSQSTSWEKQKKKRRETNFDINTDGFVLKTFSYLSCENKKRKVHLLLWIRKAN